jgi:hypothetical protein
MHHTDHQRNHEEPQRLVDIKEMATILRVITEECHGFLLQ